MTDGDPEAAPRPGLRTTRRRPFPTALVAEHIHADEAERVATTVYGVNLLLASALVGVLWRYAARERLLRPDATDRELTVLGRQPVPSLGGYLVMILVGLAVPVLAVFGYLAIAVVILVPFHALRRRPPGSGGSG